MTTPTDSILNKIRGLMAKAASTEFEAEAQAFADKAAELMARYGVEQAMIADRDPASDPVENRTIHLENPYAQAKSLLLHHIAQALNCHMIYSSPSQNNGMAFGLLFGARSDLERVEFLYTSLVLQSVRMAVRTHAPHAYSSSAVSAYRRSWLIGFANRIGERLQASKTQATRDAGTGAELVLVNRQELAQRAAKQAFPNTRKRAATISRGDAYRAGQAAASRADMGQARVSGRRTISA